MRAKLTFLLFAIFCSLIISDNAKANDSSSVTIEKSTAGGIVRGRLLKSDNKPRPYTELELVPQDSKFKSDDMRLWAITSASGLFAFRNVPEGKYTLSINFNETPSTTSPYSTYFYPHTSKRSEAKVFEVTNGSSFNQLIFHLPNSYKMKRFTGKVVWEDGEPVVNALVSLVDLNSQSDTGFGVIKSDENGIFRITGFIGRNYQIAAILFDGDISRETAPQLLAQGFSPKFYLETKTNIIKITLKRPGLLDQNKGLIGKTFYR